MQTLRDKIIIATDCILEDLIMVENGDQWVRIKPGEEIPSSGGVTYRREEIIAEMASLLFGEIKSSRTISPRIYKTALRLFKSIHINTDPVYRIRPLRDERASIRFIKGKTKKRE